MKRFPNTSNISRWIRLAAAMFCGFAFGMLRAELYLSVPDSADVGTSVEIGYMSTHAATPDGPLHKVVLLVEGMVADESGLETGVLRHVFTRPGNVPFAVKAFGTDGAVLDEWNGTVGIRGIAMLYPEDGLSIPLGSPLILTAEAVFGDKTVTQVVFETDGSSAGAYGGIAGSEDAVPPYSCVHVPDAMGIHSIRARAFHGDGTFSVSDTITVQVLPRLDGPAPVVSISDPANGASLAMGVELVIAVEVQSSGGVPIKDVGLYVDGVRLPAVDGAGVSAMHRFTWQPAQPGDYRLRAMAVDVAGRRSVSHEVRVEVVSSGCYARMVLPVDGSTYEAGKHVPLSAVAGGAGGSAERVGRVDFLVNGAKVAESVEAPYQAVWTPVRAGSYQVAARVEDVDGLSSGVSDFVTIRVVEGSPPVVHIVDPQPDERFRPGDTVCLKASGFDSNGILTIVAFYANDVWIGNGEPEDGAFVLDYQFPSAGIYAFRAVATNDTGNQAYADPVRVQVDERAGLRPLVRFISPLPDEGIHVGQAIQLGVDVRDSDGTIREVLFYLDGIPLGTATGYPYVLPSYVVDKPGVYRFRAVALDNEGNRSTPAEIEVFVHAQPMVRPGVEIVWPAVDQVFEVGQTLWVDASASDSDGSIREVRFSLNGQPLGSPVNVFPYQSAFVRLDNPGTHVIEVVALDDQGLMSPVAVRNVLVVAPAQAEESVFDPLTSNRDFVFRVYLDCLGRMPDQAEWAYAVQELDFGVVGRSTWVARLVETAEAGLIRSGYACWHAAVGRWASPQEFRYFMSGMEWSPDAMGGNPVDVHGDTRLDPTEIEGNKPSLSGGVQSRTDKDVFVFRVNAQDMVTLQTLGSTDTAGLLMDSDGHALAYDDDSGAYFNCLVQRVLDPGIYYFEVSGYLGSTGLYSLQLQIGYPGPMDVNATVQSLPEVLDTFLQSKFYLKLHGSPGALNEEKACRDWVRALFRNRFSMDPSLQQEVQAASRLASAASSGVFLFDWVNNTRVGMQDYVYGMPDVSGRDLAAFLLGSMLKRVPTVDEVESLAGLSPVEMVDRILEHPGWRGRYSLSVIPESQGTGALSGIVVAGGDSTVATGVAPSEAAAGSSLPDESGSSPFAGILETDGGWKYSPWFGYVHDDRYPWVYHEHMGWMWMQWKTPDAVSLWSSDWDWLYTRMDCFPQVFRYRDRCWMFLDFSPASGGYGVFNYSSGEWER